MGLFICVSLIFAAVLELHEVFVWKQRTTDHFKLHDIKKLNDVPDEEKEDYRKYLVKVLWLMLALTAVQLAAVVALVLCIVYADHWSIKVLAAVPLGLSFFLIVRHLFLKDKKTDLVRNSYFFIVVDNLLYCAIYGFLVYTVGF